METTQKTWPLYAKFTTVIIGLLASFYILYIGKPIIVPFAFSVIIAILLNPVVNLLCRKKFNRTIAIIISVTSAILLIIVTGYFILSQAAMLGDALPIFKQKFRLMFDDSINWISGNLNISKPKLRSMIADAKEEGMNNRSKVLGTALIGISDALVLLLLVPVYIFMILYYKYQLLAFISKLFKSDKREVVADVLIQIKSLIQSYLLGLLIEAAIVATLNSIGLLALGIQYAVLFGLVGALLNMIPYIGGIVAISLPMLIAITTKSPVYALWVLILFLIIQLIDNNYLVPKIVASKVKVNALVSIIAVLIGGALWGIAGMFLAIPAIALLKVVFDRIEALKPFGFLIGDNIPKTDIITYTKTKHKAIQLPGKG